VASNATLTFKKNALNTPVYMLATGDITIRGTISLNGQDGQLGFEFTEGAPGGFDGGAAGTLTSPPGAGKGPGGGRGSSGVQASGGGFATQGYSGSNAAGGAAYGNAALLPLIGGSGGGGFYSVGIGGSGGGGGGAILLASSTRISLTGKIQANGGNLARNPNFFYAFSGAGSGGGIRLVAPVMEGSGILGASGGENVSPGRIRVDCPPQTVRFNVAGGSYSVGRNMVAIPTNLPALHVVHAAGQAIPEGTPSAVDVLLPTGSSSNQVVTLRGRNFTGLVPCTLRVTPFSGTPISTNVVFNAGPGPATVETNLTVVIPPNVKCQVEAWANLWYRP
jgi:hypothetical protein